ncbi:Hsp20/alpha crystallin family protein [Lacticaseibacillus hulanensis]|uniref:Hsp20/alpha crystallin family protein n=1 Tax=Lacticaseibacillus hulanensis TaxID=2493111 RepID=UPI000FD8CD8C|nr:Hsp20/alpha crystallin family protein [Lacticaseibacillus hulanensis]
MTNDLLQRDGWLDDPFFAKMGRRLFGDMVPQHTLKTDIKDRDKEYQVKVDVPGLKKEDIKMNYRDDVLTIGVRHDVFDDHTDKDGNVLMSERQYGETSRSFRLPDVDRDHIKASMADGVLTVVLPKLTEAAAKDDTIAIE